MEKWGAPQILRTDCGTENGICAAIQSAIHSTDCAHQYGSSVTNQRIEALWCKFKPAILAWKTYFRELHENNKFTPLDDHQLAAIRFAFTELIPQTLDSFLLYWNTHHVRQTSATPGGVPDVLFYSHDQHKEEVSSNHIQEARDHCCSPTLTGSADYDDYLNYVFEYKNLSKPTNKEEAFCLFTKLLQYLNQ